MDGTGNDSGKLFTVWCQNSHRFSPTSGRTGPWNIIFNVQLLQQGLEQQKNTCLRIHKSKKIQEHIHHISTKTLGIFMLWPCKWLMPNLADETHTRYHNRLRHTATYHNYHPLGTVPPKFSSLPTGFSLNFLFVSYTSSIPWSQSCRCVSLFFMTTFQAPRL